MKSISGNTRGIRITDADWNALSKLANKAGITTSEFIRRTCLERVAAETEGPCTHKTVLEIPRSLLVQCATCHRIGNRHGIDNAVLWAELPARGKE